MMIMKITMMLNSMRELAFVISTIFALFMVGCHNDIDHTINDDKYAQIYLSASTERSVETRAPYDYTVPNENEDGILHAAVWASSVQLSYLNTGENGRNDDGKVAIHTSADFNSGEPQLLNQAVYPKSGTPVYFIGLHPQTGWDNNNDGKSANYTFSGAQDVMFAPRIEGQYADPTNLVFDVPVLNFKHLLTWLKIKIVAEDATTRDAWGKIISIKVNSHDRVSVAIDYTSAEGFVYADHVEYSTVGDGWFPLYSNDGTDAVFPPTSGYDMEYYPNVTAPQEVAYVLCSPVDAVDKMVIAGGEEVDSPEYTLQIETERRSVTLPIDLMKNATQYFEGSTRGKCFTLNLTFRMGNTIVVSADVEDWTLGGMGIVEL